MTAIAGTTLGNISAFARGDDLPNALVQPA
jgi:hypothetical protein